MARGEMIPIASERTSQEILARLNVVDSNVSDVGVKVDTVDSSVKAIPADEILESSKFVSESYIERKIGDVWEKQQTGYRNNDLFSVCRSDDKKIWVVGGKNNLIYYMEDDVNEWQEVELSFLTGTLVIISSLCYAKDIGVFVGAIYNGVNSLYGAIISTNGKDWEGVSVPNADSGLYKVIRGNGVFVATTETKSNKCVYSADGRSWAISNLDSIVGSDKGVCMDLTYNEFNKKFYVCNLDGVNRIAVSDNGKTWSAYTNSYMNVNANEFTNIITKGSTYVLFVTNKNTCYSICIIDGYESLNKTVSFDWAHSINTVWAYDDYKKEVYIFTIDNPYVLISKNNYLTEFEEVPLTRAGNVRKMATSNKGKAICATAMYDDSNLLVSENKKEKIEPYNMVSSTKSGYRYIRFYGKDNKEEKVCHWKVPDGIYEIRVEACAAGNDASSGVSGNGGECFEGVFATIPGETIKINFEESSLSFLGVTLEKGGGATPGKASIFASSGYSLEYLPGGAGYGGGGSSGVASYEASSFPGCGKGGAGGIGGGFGVGNMNKFYTSNHPRNGGNGAFGGGGGRNYNQQGDSSIPGTGGPAIIIIYF